MTSHALTPPSGSPLGRPGRWPRPPAAPAQVGDKTVRFILPMPPAPAWTRSPAPRSRRWPRRWASPVVVDNQPGAGGIVGLQALAKAAPDGKTLCMVSNNDVIFPQCLKSLPFDMPWPTSRRLRWSAPRRWCWWSTPRCRPTNLKELVALLKANPGKYNYGSGGNGTILHLGPSSSWTRPARFRAHIPYKGVGPMVTDLIGGQVDFGTAGAAQRAAAPQERRAAGASAWPRAQRTRGRAGDPHLRRAGPAGLTWSKPGLPCIGPKGLSAAEVKRVHEAVVTAFNDPAVKEAMAKQGNMIHVSTPEAATAHFKRELAKYAALVKKAGVEPQ